ncbi:ribonuclease E/G [Halobacillus litoralis]|nr:ribonuclease E/G [Halobacillus litoralis]
MRKLFIHTKTTEKTGVVIEQGKIQEYVVDRPGVKVISGAIFCGKVIRVDQGLQAAFIDIGVGREAFLRKETIPWCEDEISSAVKVGEFLFVQGIKEEIGHKGAQVSADLTIPGLYVIYQPYGNKVSLSKKLGAESKEKLETALRPFLGGMEGVIIRTAADVADLTVVEEELLLLKEQWEEIIKDNDKKAGLLWYEPLLPNQLMRRYPISSMEKIIVDDASVVQYLKKQFPSASANIEWKKNGSQEMPISINSLEEQITEPIVELDKGIQIVIDHTEAMTVIDVNSHKYKGKAFSNSQAFQVNMEAAEEIQRQIRLRNISGIIIIDFISMKDSSKEKHLLSEMKKLLKKDVVKTTVFGITRLGLLEMTRKRDWASPVSLLAEERESSFTMETSVYRLERDLLEASSSEAEAYLVAVHPDLNDIKKQLLSEPISSKIPQELFVRQDSTIQSYQIELGGSLDMIRDAVQRRGYHVDNLF